jgi:uncharacterized protein
MDIQREQQQELLNMAKSYPVVKVTGPRQAGKTTLARHCFPEKAYVNLEIPSVREAAHADPIGLLEKYPEGVILDEIQYAPKLLSYIQAIVDEQPGNGRFILTGSHQLSLQAAVSQSLAGRAALLYLLPLTLHELQQRYTEIKLTDFLLQGFYPRIHKENLDPPRAYRQYLQTYVERDLRQLINVKDLMTFQTFLRLVAAQIGQVMNYSTLADACGVSHHTIKHWLSILEASFILYRLPPYFANIKKQLVKSPKLYFIDVGLACHLLRIETKEQLEASPYYGHLFENFIVLELIKARFNQGLDPNLYFYRDAQKHEVDLIYQYGYNLIPIEIKKGMTFHARFLQGLEYFKTLFPQQVKEGYLIYSGLHEQRIHDNHLIHFSQARKIVLSEKQQ